MIEEKEDDSNFGNKLTDEDMENKIITNSLSVKEVKDLIIQKREEEDLSLTELLAVKWHFTRTKQLQLRTLRNNMPMQPLRCQKIKVTLTHYYQRV